MEIRKISEIVKRIPPEDGVCEPYLCVCESKLYYVKGHYAGYADCIHELVAGSIGRLLGINIPPFALVELPMELAELDAEAARDIGIEIPSFASAKAMNAFLFEPGASTDDEADTDKRKIFLFDWWTGNIDRTSCHPNLLVDINNRLVVIDHNQAFGTCCSLDEFTAGHVFGDTVRRRGMNRSDEEPVMDRIMNEYWDEIVESIPFQWLERCPEGEGIVDKMRTVLLRYKNDAEAFWKWNKKRL